MVGCLVTRGAEIIGEGWHRRYGGAHAEAEALAIAGSRAVGATLYVTLEPCCHHGKTPPCAEAIIRAGIRRVVVAQRDPFPAVDGGGIERLQTAGLEVVMGIAERQAKQLNAPYRKLIETGKPWLIAKWAMTLDGKIATTTGDSRWISSPASRSIVHRLRGQVDAILIGRVTAQQDNPQLTARPPGPRLATRIVVDTKARLAGDRQLQLLKTAREVPVLMAVGQQASEVDRNRLTDAGCEVFVCSGNTPAGRLDSLLAELGRRRMTNVLVEGGGRLFGSLLDLRAIDEVYAFVAPKLVGGHDAPTAMAGQGTATIREAIELLDLRIEEIDGDVCLHGRTSPPL